ncbi:hypothetical protein ElyMa_004214600 [Elysia marginata]|uniref:Uncharacterized protein n=1 Tax=Elysia marginata TaxID=1093978 RepID=A0AAV4GNZ9_9GAST|nr:hypothetical protein ElyMa_004214600 [Elysia marginata]
MQLKTRTHIEDCAVPSQEPGIERGGHTGTEQVERGDPTRLSSKQQKHQLTQRATPGIGHRRNRTGTHGCLVNYPVVTGSPQANCFFRDCDARLIVCARRGRGSSGGFYGRLMESPRHHLAAFGWMSSFS